MRLSPLNSSDMASSFRGAERHRTTLPRTSLSDAESGGPRSVMVSLSSLDGVSFRPSMVARS
jgi:hypothetical protein